MARRPLPTSSGTVALRPVASPVDTYVQPPATNGMLEFAQSMKEFDPAMRGFLEGRAKEQNEADAIRGEAAFHQNNAVGFAEGVRTGKIPAQHSQAFMRAYKAAEGAALGTRLQSAYQQAWDAWDGKNSEDPAAFDKFYSDFVSANVTSEDPDVLRGLLPALRSLGGSAVNAHTNYRSKEVYQGSLTSHLAGVNSTIDQANEDGLASGYGTSYAGTAEAIERQRDAFVKSGGRPSDFDEGAMNAIAGKAIELRDPGLLDFFDRKVPGEDHTYGETPYGSKLKQATVEGLEVIARQGITDADRKAEQQRKAAEDAATRAAIEAMVSGGEIPEEIIKAGEKADPLFRTKIGEWRSGLDKGSRDPALVRQVMREIMDGDGVEAVIQAAPQITSADDLNQLHTFAKSFELSKDKIADALSTPSAKSILEALNSRTKKDGGLLDPISGLSNEGMEAQYDFKRLMQEYVLANPNASYQELEDAVGKFGRSVLDRIKPAEDPSEAGGTYERDAKVGDFDNPYTSMATPEQDDEPVTSVPKQAPVDDRSLLERLGPDKRASQVGERFGREQWSRSEDGQYFRDLSPEEQAAITETAAKRGEPLANVVKALRQMGAKSKAPITAPAAPSGARTPDGTPTDPVAYRPDEEDTGGADGRPEFTNEMAEEFLNVVMAAPEGSTGPLTARAPDAQAAHLLDLIGKHEAAGNYNAVYGNAKAGRDLSTMTLDQILGQQQAGRRAGVKSTAIGRYQFIYKTLRGLKNELGLSGSERFTPELQDKLGMALLERRGWNEFKAGRISQRQFARRLSQEWASLPDPTTGRSYYDGDGLNAAGTSTQAVYSALGFRGGPSRPAPTMAAYAPTSPAMTGGGDVSSAPGRDPYANIPEAEREQFRTWNSDPVANHETNLASIDQTLAGVVRRAQELSGVRFVIGSGKRDDALQRKAVEWGWSKTHDSDHEHGGAVDLWGLDGNEAVTFDPETQRAIVKAMKTAAKELGVDLDVGADWRGFTDNPHFALKGRRA